METKKLSTAHKVAITGLLLSCVAVVIQKIMGVTNYPPVPPAIIIALIASVSLYFAPWKKWAAIIGWLVPTSLIVGPVIDKWHEKLWQPDAVAYPGIVLQWAAIILAFIGASIVLKAVFTKKSR